MSNFKVNVWNDTLLMTTFSMWAYYIYIRSKTIFLAKGYEVIVLLDMYILFSVKKSIIHTIA